MSDVALYRKYRPRKFSDLVGQEPIRVTLSNAVKQGQVSHGYLFCGTRGTGKTSTARLVAKALSCENVKDGDPCGECGICNEIEDGSLIDLVEIDAASNRGIDEIRDLKEKIHFAPTRAKAKVYIIDEVHMLTKEAFNALLKTLEEPPEHSYFILATTEVHKIPETIISRCQRFDFKRIAAEDLVDRLKFIAGEEKIEFEEEAIGMIVKHVNGGMRDAIGLLEQIGGTGKVGVEEVKQILGVTGDRSLEKMYGLLVAGDSAGALDLVEELFVEGQDFKVFVKELTWYLRGKMVDAVKNKDTATGYAALGLIEKIHQVSSQMDGSPIPQLPLEAAIMKICEGKSGSVSAAPKVAVPKAEPAKVGAAPVPPKKVEAPAVAAPKKESAPVSESKAAVESGPAAGALPATPAVANTSSTEKSGVAAVDQDEPQGDAAPANVAAAPAGEPVAVNRAELEARWKDVLEKINNSSLRRSFSQGKISQVSGNKLEVAFGSKFILGQVSSPTEVAAVQDAFMAIFNQHIELKMVYTEAEKKAMKTADQLAEKAEELFS